MKYKCILLSLTLIGILLVCVSSITAAEVNDSITSNTTSDLSHLQINNDDLNNDVGFLENEEVDLQNDSDNLNLSEMISINQTSNNTFTIELDNMTTTAYRAYVYDLDSFNKILESLAKMDKQELEAKLKQAQSILNSKNIDPNHLEK